MKNHKEIPFIRELMKGKSDAEICEAEENFRRYLLLVKRMAERIETDEKQGIERPVQKAGQMPVKYRTKWENGQMITSLLGKRKKRGHGKKN